MLQPATAQTQQNAEPPSDAQRIEQLEQRILDLQTVVGTLQSFVRDSGAAPAPGVAPPPGGFPENGGAAPSELSIRVLALETQIRALTGQMKEVVDRLDQAGAAGGQSGSSSLAPHPWQQGQGTGQPGTQTDGANFASPPQPSSQPSGAEPAVPAAEPRSRLGAITSEPQQNAQLPPLPAPTGAQDGARAIYDASYQSFVRNDLQSAEQGFRNFVDSYPDDPLSANAHYWLGRTYFQRQQYEPAAKSFLAGYKRDKKSTIAPDSLLHLGLALSRLGETEAACSTLGAISKQYPDAPARLHQEAADAIKQARC